KGKYANAFSLYEKPDYLMLAEIRENILDVYLEFKDRVANGRHIDLNQVEDVAQGQIWSSAAARSGNLIDSIGLLSDAVVKAAQLAGIDDYTVSYYPEKKNLLEEFLRKAFKMDLAVSLGTDELNDLLPVEEFKHKLKSIRQDPIQMILPFRIEE
ncbi:MAG: S49 family peptidase, partial [Candidatus Cloacimonetes bacterium]|nr:S49 family peptidase [Candidatus Cloacimonadota bacterium]